MLMIMPYNIERVVNEIINPANFVNILDARKGIDAINYRKSIINAMLDDAEADFAAGKGISAEDVDREMEEELQREEAEEARNLFYHKMINKPLYAVV